MKTVIKNGTIINEGKKIECDLLIINDRIEKIGTIIDADAKEIDATGKWIIPGIIDDQVHFREPGLTHKATIETESKAAVAGGITSFMEMPNTKPPATSSELLEQKYEIGKKTSWCNYSFFMGTTNHNYDDLMKINYEDVCGLKIFMGSSTGNMLVDNENTLESIFKNFPHLIATHCEDEQIINTNLHWYMDNYGDSIHTTHHPLIRNEEACYKSSSYAVALAQKYKTRLHVLHISTADELDLFDNNYSLADKKITAEVCVHHLYFTSEDYKRLGRKIKCNPAIKNPDHAPQLFEALLDDRLDLIATDHAPHTVEEKNAPYLEAPSGLPLIQHSLNIMLNFYQEGKISLEKIVEKMCHAPAICFNIKDRGFLREGCFADIAIIDPNSEFTVSKENILYKCGWSPLEQFMFKGKVSKTIVNGHMIYDDGIFFSNGKGMRLKFNP